MSELTPAKCDICTGPIDGAAFLLQIIGGEIEPHERKNLFCSHLCLRLYIAELGQGYSEGIQDADLPPLTPVRSVGQAVH